jgi:hypothetical protein
MPGLRNGTSYVNSKNQQGRSGRKAGNIPGTRANKRPRRSERNDTSEDLLNDDTPSSSEYVSGYDKAMSTRSYTITCLRFGGNRHAMYPTHKFCSKCDTWENGGLKGSAKRDSRRNCCDAKHTRPDFPTTRKKVYIPSRRVGLRNFFVHQKDDFENIIFDSDSDTSDNEPAPIVTVDTTIAASRSETGEGGSTPHDWEKRDETVENMRESVREVELQLSFAHDTNLELIDTVAALKRQLKKYERGNSTLLDHLKRATTAVVRQHPRLGRKKVGEAISDMSFSLLDGIASYALENHVKRKLRETIFAPWRVARLMDIHGGALNLRAIALLRTLETGGEKYVRDTLIPSTNKLQNVFTLVEQLGAVQCPFTCISYKGGESIVFDYMKATKTVIEAHGLTNKAASEGVSIANSIDGALLQDKITHVMGGIKVNDKAAINPLTGVPLCMDSNSWQSRNLVFPFQIHLGKENTLMYQRFAPFFDFFSDLAENGNEANGIKRIRLVINCDLSAVWKGIGRGGGAKVHNKPCHCCGISSKSLHHPKASRCERYCSSNALPDDWRCYHHDIVTDETLLAMEEQVNELESALKDYADKLADSNIVTEDPDANEGHEASKTNPASIWFEPRTANDRNNFSKLINDELALRGITNLPGNLTTRRVLLKGKLADEWKLLDLKDVIDACERKETALFLLMQTVPCILHLENRVGLKQLEMLIVKGLSNAEEGTILSHLLSPIKRKDEYVRQVEVNVNEVLLGDELSPSQWHCPYDKKSGTLGPVSFENYRTRKVIANLEVLVEISVPDFGEKAKWNRCLIQYRTALKLLRQRTNLDAADLAAFQKAIDSWHQDYVKLHGLAGQTNYVHMLSSGHIAEYLFKYGNLYDHSQQGWEAFNSLLKSVYYRRTPRGGGRGLKSKLKPLARWLQRRMLWLCGVSGDTLKEQVCQAESDALATTSQDEENENQEEDDDIFDVVGGYV